VNCDDYYRMCGHNYRMCDHNSLGGVMFDSVLHAVNIITVSLVN